MRCLSPIFCPRIFPACGISTRLSVSASKYFVDFSTRYRGNRIAERRRHKEVLRRAKKYWFAPIRLQPTHNVPALPFDCGNDARARCRSSEGGLAVSSMWSHLPLPALEDSETGPKEGG